MHRWLEPRRNGAVGQNGQYHDDDVEEILLPFVFKRDEQPIQVRLGTHYYLTRDYQMRASVGTLAAGLPWHYALFGRSRSVSMPVDMRRSDYMGTGTLVVSNQHVMFSSEDQGRAVRFAFGKIVSVIPYSDGFGVIVEGSKPGPHTFITGFPGTTELELIQGSGLPPQLDEGDDEEAD
jgi:hypothetical protein